MAPGPAAPQSARGPVRGPAGGEAGGHAGGASASAEPLSARGSPTLLRSPPAGDAAPVAASPDPVASSDRSSTERLDGAAHAALERALLQGQAPDRGAPPGAGPSRRRNSDEQEENLTKLRTAQEVKDFMNMKEGSTIRAWLRHFDLNNDLKISHNEFVRGLKKLDYHGDPSAVFIALDVDHSQELSLQEIDEAGATVWQNFRAWCVERFSSTEEMLERLRDGPQQSRTLMKRGALTSSSPRASAIQKGKHAPAATLDLVTFTANLKLLGYGQGFENIVFQALVGGGGDGDSAVLGLEHLKWFEIETTTSMPEPLLSREWRLVDAGHTSHSVPSTWDIYEVEFYSTFAAPRNDGGLRCVGWLKPTSITASSVYSTNHNGPDEAIDGVVKWGNGWRSANFSGPGAWLQVSFAEKTAVQCVRLYQESTDNGGFEYVVSEVALQGLDESLGDWREASSWRAGTEDMGSRFQLLPGWRWITMAVGRYLETAAAECPDPLQSTDLAAVHFCCVWPKLSNAPVSGWLEWVEQDDAGRPSCSDGATVRSGTRCQVRSTSCGSSGDLECVNGKMVLNMIGEDVELDTSTDGCIQQQVDELTRKPVEPVIHVEVIPHSPYCSRFTISHHPLDRYNGEYVQQPSSRNHRPWFANAQLGRLYWYDGCDFLGEPGWSLDDRPWMSEGCTRWQRGGWRPAPAVGGLPSGLSEWRAGEMDTGGTWELDCQGSHYALLGTGDCRDDLGRSANMYYELDKHTALTCKSQCDIDPQCIAYHYVPPSVDLEPGHGSCFASAPSRQAGEHPGGTGWLYRAGDGASEVTTTLFAGGDEHGTGWCFLKVDWQEGSDPPWSGSPRDAAEAEAAGSGSFSDRLGSVAVVVASMTCFGFFAVAAFCVRRTRAAKDPERTTLADARGDVADGAVVEEHDYAGLSAPSNSVVGKPLGQQPPSRSPGAGGHKPYVHSVYGGAIYGGAGGVVHAGGGSASRPAGAEKARGAPSASQGFPVQAPRTPLGRRTDDPLMATTPASAATTPSEPGSTVAQAQFRWPPPQEQPEEEPQFPLEVELDTSGARSSAARAVARPGAGHGAWQAARETSGSNALAGPAAAPVEAERPAA